VTVHKLLGNRPQGTPRYRFNASNPLAYDLVVVDEASMLSAFVRFVCDHDVDVLIGYNIFGFDWVYILDRMETHGVLSSSIAATDTLGAGHARRVERSLASAAYGCNEHVLLDFPGRIQIDLKSLVILICLEALALARLLVCR
jgi:DNA polymerase elongation subunit (family B)